MILHGLFGSSDNWVSMMSMLKDHFTVIVPDERNHGRSPHSDRFDYKAMRDDALELLEAEGLKSAFVAGHSMGGKVAMEMAIHAPETVKKLIVLDISSKAYPIRHEFILHGLKSMNLASIKSRQEADAQLAPYIAEPRIRQFLLKNLRRQADGSFEWKINLNTIEENIQNIGKAQSAEKPVKVPSLFIGGEKSDYITPEDETMIRRIFPISRIVMVPGAGHWLHAERPDMVYRLITEFLLETKLTAS